VDCVLCSNKEDRAYKPTTDGKWIHVSCALWHTGPLFVSPEKREPVSNWQDVSSQRFQVPCAFCSKKGACIQCTYGRCAVSYHVPCAFRNGIKFEQREGDEMQVFFHTFCEPHQPLSSTVPSDNHSPNKSKNKKRSQKKTNKIDLTPPSSPRTTQTTRKSLFPSTPSSIKKNKNKKSKKLEKQKRPKQNMSKEKEEGTKEKEKETKEEKKQKKNTKTSTSKKDNNKKSKNNITLSQKKSRRKKQQEPEEEQQQKPQPSSPSDLISQSRSSLQSEGESSNNSTDSPDLTS